ncbi:MAG: hypothetical protein HYS39_00490 [Proteobacteria bacterium]|nr:hypothetical protein [Pseudomonadota bacterium]
MSLKKIDKVNSYYLSILAAFLSFSLSHIFVFIPIFDFFFSYFSSLPLYIISFLRGPFYGLFSCFFYFLLMLFLFGLNSALTFLVITVLPLIIISRGLQHYTSEGNILSQLCWTGLFLIGMLLIFIPLEDPVSYFQKIVFQTNETIFKQLSSNIFLIIPSIGVISWVILNVSNAVLARYFLHTQRLKILPLILKFPTYWDILFFIGLLFTFSQKAYLDFIGANLLVVSCIPLFALGLNILYLWLQNYDNARLWFTVFLVLTTLLVWPSIIVIALGILEPWYHLKHKLEKKGD